MSVEALEAILEANKGGVWFVTAGEARGVGAAAKKAGFAYFHIDGKTINRKEQFLNNVATALHFPKSFGHNWDALEECLSEMESDADGFVIFYDHIDGLLGTHPDQFETLVEIFRDAVGSWKEDGTPMVVLLAGTKPPKGVSKLS
ncbi:MAG TPA: barstar family protein [Usitatibacter sp.]|jgi:RNAse (barnase) inhibitor barstar|nr:barstar family protein [Usitatibacter sp.]